MESLQKIITITGIPSSGKSTLAKKLAEFEGDALIFCVDYIYHAMAKKLGKDIHEFTSPNGWRKMDEQEINKLKKEAYTEAIKGALEKLPKTKTLIVEGYGLCFFYDRLFLGEVLKESKAKTLHLHKEVSYQEWCKYKGVIDTKKRAEEYENLQAIASIYRPSLIVKD